MIKNILKMRSLDWTIMLVLTLSYIAIDFKHSFYANNMWSFTLDIYNICPQFFNVICFPISLFMLLKSNYMITKNFDKWISIIVLFIYINPLIWKHIIIPLDNLIFSLVIFLSTLCFLYIRSEKFKKEFLIPFILFIISCAIINSYFIVCFCSLIIIYYFLNFKQKEYIKIISVSFLISIFLCYFIFFHDIDTLSDNISLFINNTYSVLYSFGGFLLLFSLIGLLIAFIKKYKSLNRESFSHFITILCMTFLLLLSCLLRLHILPYYLVITAGVILLYNHTPLIGKLFATFLLLFSISSFYSVMDNYQKNMEFKETTIEHIVEANKEYGFQVIVGELPESPTLTKYNFYPESFFYQNPQKYQYMIAQKGIKIIFINKNDINHRFNIYKSKLINDFKYFSIYKQGSISYLYIKNNG